MQLHDVKPIHPGRRARRIGRGGKRGTYSGKGIKGQKARTGTRYQPRIREFIKRYPKLRGYRFKNVGVQPVSVNIEVLERYFQNGETVNPTRLVEKRAVRKVDGKIPVIKVLGQGELTKSLTIEKCLISKAALAKIEKAGGTFAK